MQSATLMLYSNTFSSTKFLFEKGSRMHFKCSVTTANNVFFKRLKLLLWLLNWVLKEADRKCERRNSMVLKDS